MQGFAVPTAVEERTDSGNAFGNLDHYWCPWCDVEDRALCGADIADHVIGPFRDQADTCVVCREIDVCPVCGGELEMP